MKRFVERLLPLLELIILWEAVAWIVKSPALPTPGKVLPGLVGNLGILGVHSGVSVFRAACAVVISGAIAVPMGLAVGGHPSVYRYISPLVFALYPLPKVAFLPVIMLLFGLGDFAKVFLVSIIIFFQILVAVIDARRSIDRQLVDSIVTLGPTRLQLLRHVLFPAVVPAVVTAVRISIGTALAVLFFAETFGTEYGLGFYIMDAWMRLDYRDMFSGIVSLSVIGFGLFRVVDLVESRLSRWQKPE